MEHREMAEEIMAMTTGAIPEEGDVRLSLVSGVDINASFSEFILMNEDGERFSVRVSRLS